MPRDPVNTLVKHDNISAFCVKELEESKDFFLRKSKQLESLIIQTTAKFELIRVANSFNGFLSGSFGHFQTIILIRNNFHILFKCKVMLASGGVASSPVPFSKTRY
jgi:hypothetical protein